MNKASCLILLSNAVLVWNTVRIAEILNQLRAAWGGPTRPRAKRIRDGEYFMSEYLKLTRHASGCAALGMLLTLSCPAVAQQPVTIGQILAGTMLPDIEVATFEHSEALYPSRRVPRKGPIRSLLLALKQLKNVHFQSGARNYDLFDYLADNRIAGLLILKDGKVAFEDYELGATPMTRWASFSMAKSISSTLVGAAVRQGLIQSLDVSLSRYVPTLKGGGYDGVSIRNLLQMASGVKWDETYTDSRSDVSKLGLLLLSQSPVLSSTTCALCEKQESPAQFGTTAQVKPT
jgi:hypothetical protein